MSTFDGFIKEINWVSVDCFEPVNVKSSTVFFLSHCHTDHMNGLLHADLGDKRLYCSGVTSIILRNLGYNKILGNIQTLNVCSPTVISIPQIDGESKPQDVIVTILPAGHCPGSVMFLFETVHETILYTGDFRITENDIATDIYRYLHHSDGTLKKITCLYLDTTFWNNVGINFPTRDESLQLIINQINEFRCNHSNGHVHIERPARYGSEFLAVSLFDKFKQKVHVSDGVYRNYQGIGEVEECLTLDNTCTFLHMCDNLDKVGFKRNFRCVPRHLPVLYVRPTAQWYARGQVSVPLKLHHEVSFLQVSLSMHASRAEIISLINYLQPRKIFACVIPQDLKITQTELNDQILTVAASFAKNCI